MTLSSSSRGQCMHVINGSHSLLTADEGKGCVILPRPRNENQEDTEIGTDSSSFLLSAPPSTPSLSRLLILYPHPVPFPSPCCQAQVSSLFLNLSSAPHAKLCFLDYFFLYLTMAPSHVLHSWVSFPHFLIPASFLEVQSPCSHSPANPPNPVA